MKLIPHSRPEVSSEGVEAVVRVLRAGQLSSGEEVALLEADLARLFGGGIQAVAVSSGTAALYLALAALEVGRGDEVVVPSYTCNSLFASVAHVGASAICADSRPDGVTLSAESVGRVRTADTRAVVVPHTCGYRADVPELVAAGCPVVEDCAPGFDPAAVRMGIGVSGHVTVLSFFATKMLSAGEGGACLTRHAAMADRMRAWRDCDGRVPDSRAFNFKMSDPSAALARVQVAGVGEQGRRRAMLACRYDDAFGRTALRRPPGQSQPLCYRYLVETEREVDTVVAEAAQRGVICRRPVWRPLHLTLGGDCPRADWLHHHVLSVPLYPGLSESEVEHVCAVLPPML